MSKTVYTFVMQKTKHGWRPDEDVRSSTKEDLWMFPESDTQYILSYIDMETAMRARQLKEDLYQTKLKNKL